MSDSTDPVKTIFLQAIEHHSPQEWPAFLDEACAGDAALRAGVENLLRAQVEMGSFHEQARAFAPTIDPSPVEPIGTMLGPYKLLQQIGEGGMGIVFMAEQTEPVRRKVAVKIIKPGMDSRQIIARFEAERQALALMDHVNIARVFDAGATENGRPYFVMELVHGVPITKYCDENRLTPRQRLELFVPVCQAIQHAHQKGIIHRDIKPSNIIVTLYDGKPVAKVIDFGVAKATEQKLTERTLFTQYGTVVGTLEYMSPEQAEMSALGVDTRSDIYSLGVLLYELLTGSTPLSRKRVREAAYAEILRMIKEDEPPKPSTRLSDSGEALASISANRHTEPAKLAKLVRGELDWIVMKTLEKDRNRRYETANGFALDIQRYLADEPVLACPPSAVYRFRKFVRRNKTGLAVAGLVLFFLVLIGSGAGWAVRDRAAREADLARDKATRQRKLSFEIEHALDDATKARARALALTDNPYDWDAALAEASSELKRGSGLAAQAETTLEPALREGLQALQALLDADQADHRFAARFEEIRLEQAQVNVEISAFKFEIAFPALQKAFRRRYRIEFGATPVEQAVVTLQQRPKPMQDVLLAALEICLDQVPKDDRQVRPWLAAVLDGADTGPWRKRSKQALQASDWKAFEQVVEEAVTARQPPALLLRLAWKIPWDSPICLNVMRRIRQAYPGDFWANHDLAQILHYRHSRPAEAIRYYTAAQALRSHNPATCVDLGNALREIGELDAAVSAYREALDGHPDYTGALERLIQALSQKPDLDETIDELREMIRSRDHVPATSADGAALSILHFRLADLLSSQKRFAEADTAYQIARAGWEKLIAEFNHADHHTQLGGALLNWALSCKANGRMEEAEKIFREAALAFEALQTNFPNESRWATHELGYIYFQLGELLSGFHGREEDGEKAYRQSLGYHEEQLAKDPENRDYQERMTWSYSGLARLLRKSKRPTEALPFDAKRVLLVQKLASGTALARDLNNLAWNLAVDPDPQMRDAEQAVELADKAVELEPAQGSYWNTLGTARYRAGNWQPAIEALKTSEQVFRGAHFGFNAFFLAMAHWQRGDHEQARKCYAAAQVWMERHASKNEELLRFRGEAAVLLGLPEQLSTDQEEAKSDDLKYGMLIVAARPEAAWAYQLRAQTLVSLDQIDRAEADFAKAIELGADDVMIRYSQALARAATGDLTGYRGACAAMLDRFAATDKPDVAHWVAWTTAIVPAAVDDLHRPVQLAELARKSEPDNGSFCNALGAALYRAGDFDEAAATLNELNTAWQQAATRPITYSPAYTWFFLAMTHQRLGDADEARQWLDKAIARAEQENQNDGTSWNRRVTLQLLRREAETLLGERGEAAGTEEDAEKN